MHKGVFVSGADDDAKEGELCAVETHNEDARLNEISNQVALVAGLVAHAGMHARLFSALFGLHCQEVPGDLCEEGC